MYPQTTPYQSAHHVVWIKLEEESEDETRWIEKLKEDQKKRDKELTEKEQQRPDEPNRRTN
jgi:hypothetical protein